MSVLSKKMVLCGAIGAIGALLTIIADVTYNVFGGNEVGSTLYITFLGLFSFPLWWGGIWVIYQGLKPAGVWWSLVPCIIFAFYTSTINVFYHACYPFWAVLNERESAVQGETLSMIQQMIEDIKGYTNIIYTMDSVFQIVICLWMAISILRGKTYFPKWIILLIPICPMLIALVINLVFKGFFNSVEPYIACGSIFVLFMVATFILNERLKKGIDQQ